MGIPGLDVYMSAGLNPLALVPEGSNVLSVTNKIIVENLSPSTPTGSFPAKAVEAERIQVGADVFRDGHGLLAAEVRFRPRSAKSWRSSPMVHRGNDRWEATIALDELGVHEFQVRAWTDRYGTWVRDTTAKLEAGVDIGSELLEGAEMLRAVPSRAGKATIALLSSAAKAMIDPGPTPPRFAAGTSPEVVEAMELFGGRPDLTVSRTMLLSVDRRVALYGAWYEFFPRSEGGFNGATKRLIDIADMGFDVVYLPPIHPIGTTARKGRNNSTKAVEGDPGSPWAIGSPEGGHTAIHPELGTFDDFQRFVEEAEALGIEVALDYALQCSPDHPWVSEHPEWFVRRPDGTIRYAENPPKKYQDIYPPDFWTPSGREELWQACLHILEFWISKGIKIFRVDNPHTKPVALWEWLISKVGQEHPDVVFLAEAFTRPKMMSKLAEVGFHQSYTYFTWRNTKQEITDYVNELAYGPTSSFMRPTFWTNTPDILAGPLRNGSRDAFKMRLVLAATLVPSYGMYSGFELMENQPASDTNEEYLDSEKYEVKDRDWESPNSLAPYIRKINDIRRRHPSFRWLRNIRFHHADNTNVIAYTRNLDDEVMLMVVNLTPDVTAETTLWLDLATVGIAPGPLEAYDELTGQTFMWEGPSNYVRLDPGREPAHIIHLRPADAGAQGSMFGSADEGRPPEIWKG